jgi:multidrug resistance protein, MATE family
MNGHGPIPALGAAGLGWATTAVLWAQVGAFVLTLQRARRVADLHLFAGFQRPRWAPIRELLRLGVPMGIAIFMEGSLFVATALIIATLGELPIAAHQVAILVASVCFMVPLGIAMATTVRVGQAVGADDRDGVRWAAIGGVGLGLITQTVSAVLLVAFGGWLAALISDDPGVIVLATTLMLYAAVFQYSDGLQALAGGALRGLKDTRIPAWITVLSYWGVGLPLGVGLGIAAGWGAIGFWVGLIGGLSVAAALLTGRFWRLLHTDLWRMPGAAPSVTV